MNEADEDLSVDVEGVTLRKTLNDHQFETLAVVFDIRSGREDPASVTIRDAVPDGVSAEDIGFHPEYGGEHWRADGESVVFARTFEPGEQYTTVYGVRDFEGPNSALLTEPTVSVDEAAIDAGVGGIDELVSEDESDLVREVIAGERDSLPGMGGSAGSAADDWAEADIGTRDATDAAEAAGTEPDEEWAEGPEAEDDWAEPDEGWAETEEPSDEPGPASGEAAGTASPGTDGPADEDSEAGPEDGATEPAPTGDEGTDTEPTDGEAITASATGGVARVLAKELRAGNVSREDRRLLREELLPDDGSTDARIKRLQTQVADLAAYTDALEAFLDEEGGAEAVLGELEADLHDVADDLEESIEAVSATVDSLTSDLASVEDEVAAVAGDVEAVSETTGRLDDDVDELRSKVGRLDALDRRLEGVEDEVSGIEDELDDLATFRERLSSVFGAGGMGGEAPDDTDG